MAEDGSWPSIQKYGLLSTSALLDLFRITGRMRAEIEETHRKDKIHIRHQIHGNAIIRDQKPMNDGGLIRCLDPKITPSLWYKILNEKVFFWLTRERLDRLLSAKAYRGNCHCILTVKTSALLEKYSPIVMLSPINSGCTKPYPWPRGLDTFLPLNQYPYHYWHKKRRGKDPIVELAVRYSVPDICSVLIRVERVHGTAPGAVIWER